MHNTFSMTEMKFVIMLLCTAKEAYLKQSTLNHQSIFLSVL